MRRSTARKYRATVLEIVEAVSGLGLKLGGLCLFLSALYLIWGFATKQVLILPKLPVWSQHRVIANVNIVTTAFELSFLVFVASLVVRRYSEDVLGYALSLAGIALYFGGPYAALAHLGPEAARNVAVVLTVEALRTAAVFAFLPGIALILRDLYIKLSFALTRVRFDRPALTIGPSSARRIIRRTPIYAKCWQMHYCADFVRRVCPAFRSRKSCWRIKRGCYCDEATLMAAMRGGTGDERFRKQVAQGMMGRRLASLTPAEKRARCRQCSIYIEHQRQKYRLMSALVIPAVLVVFAASSGLLRSWVGGIIAFTERFMQFASFQPEQSPIGGWLGTGGEVATLEWVFVVWLGIIALSYALHAVEYYVFKLQL